MSLADDANLLLIPTGYKAQKLYSIFPTSGVGDFDFARTTTATRVAKNGFITTVGTNVPRLNYDILDGEVVGCPHLLLEPSRTNLIQYSEDLSQWSLTNGTLSANSVISPDGTLNADKVVFNNVALDLKRTVTVTANTTYTFSFYIKLESGTGLQGRFYDNSNSANIEYYDYSNQVLGTDWTRVTRQVTTPSGCTQMQVWLLAASSSLVTASFWGAMLEQGSYPTSYIKTTSAAVTRAAETCNGSGNAATFNDSEGVLMAEISALADISSLRTITIGDNSSSNAISIRIDNANQIVAYVNVGGVNQCAITASVPTSLFNKCLIKYKANDFSAWVNGFKIGVDTSGIIFPSGTLNRLNFDIGYGSVSPFYGKTKQIQYHSTALSDSDLEKLTSWTSFEDMAQSQLYTIQ
jgi:hypothetical protein